MSGNGKRNRKRRIYDYTLSDFEDAVKEDAVSMFQKIFTYTKSDEETVQKWTLPTISGSTIHWQEETLQQHKIDLNQVKSSLSNYDINEWHDHTSSTNKAGQVMGHIRRKVKPELCTQAWCKFFEIVGTFPIVPKHEQEFNSFHLCEAPGAFISSLNHYLCSSGYTGIWQWKGSTLNPYYEGNDTTHMIEDDRLIYETLDKWYFGTDNSGDITVLENSLGLQEEASRMGSIKLVTADGSIDCQNRPAEQEQLVAPLHWYEMTTAFSVLSAGGCFVIKFFTMFEDVSVCHLYLLNCLFEEVNVFKPATSKSGNSEVYVVCLRYLGLDSTISQMLQAHTNQMCLDSESPLFAKDSIPESFMKQHIDCCQLFTELQKDTIQMNIQLHDNIGPQQRAYMRRVQHCCALMYVERYQAQPIENEARIVPDYEAVGKKMKFSSHPNTFKPRVKHEGSYCERLEWLHLPWNKRLQHLQNYQLENTGIYWSQSNIHFDEEEFRQWTLVEGKRISQIWTSKFCDNSLHLKYLDMIKNSEVHHGTVHSTVALEVLFHEILKESKNSQDEITLSNSRDGCNQVHECIRKIMLANGTQNRESDPAEDTNNKRKLHILDFGDSLHQMGKEELKAKLEMTTGFLNIIEKLKKGDMFLGTFQSALTRYTMSWIFIIYGLFEKITVHVPNQTDATNFYVAAVRCKAYDPTLVTFLSQVKARLNEINEHNSDRDVLQFVPIQLLYELHFHQMMTEGNNRLLKRKMNTLLDRERKNALTS